MIQKEVGLANAGALQFLPTEVTQGESCLHIALSPTKAELG